MFFRKWLAGDICLIKKMNPRKRRRNNAIRKFSTRKVVWYGKYGICSEGIAV
jgi:hypothetical protein